MTTSIYCLIHAVCDEMGVDVPPIVETDGRSHYDTDSCCLAVNMQQTVNNAADIYRALRYYGMFFNDHPSLIHALFEGKDLSEVQTEADAADPDTVIEKLRSYTDVECSTQDDRPRKRLYNGNLTFTDIYSRMRMYYIKKKSLRNIKKGQPML